MTTKEKVEKLELENAVEDLTIVYNSKTFQIYPWIKGRLFHKLITGNETLYSRGVKLYWQQFVSIFYGLNNIFGRYTIWVFTNSVERRLIDGKYFDKLFDYLGNNYPAKTLIIELRLYRYFKRREVASKNVMSKSFFMLFESIYAKLFLRKVKLEKEEILQKIFKETNAEMDYNWVIRKYLAQYRMMKFWLKILPNPKVVCLSVSYTSFGYIRAFKEAGIKVVEMQHGVMTKNHHAYFYKKELDAIQFPDLILTIGEKELAVFDEENKFPTKTIQPIGSMILDYYSSKVSLKANNPPKVLFTLQDGIMSEKLLAFVEELKDQYNDELEIIIQPRRGVKADYIQQFPYLNSIEFSERDFYSTVIECDLHATVYSTTAIESLALGVPSILINIDNQAIEQLGETLGQNAYTKIVNSATEFVEAMKDLKHAEKHLVMDSNSINVKANYKQNINRVMDSLLNAKN